MHGTSWISRLMLCCSRKTRILILNVLLSVCAFGKRWPYPWLYRCLQFNSKWMKSWMRLPVGPKLNWGTGWHESVFLRMFGISICSPHIRFDWRAKASGEGGRWREGRREFQKSRGKKEQGTQPFICQLILCLIPSLCLSGDIPLSRLGVCLTFNPHILVWHHCISFHFRCIPIPTFTACSVFLFVFPSIALHPRSLALLLFLFSTQMHAQPITNTTSHPLVMAHSLLLKTGNIWETETCQACVLACV